jgi:hypothetical protein
MMVVPEDVEPHREGDRNLEPDDYSEFDDEPTHEKWRRGSKWR